jgi:uncharacterized protein YllA (UPF0747 family)
MVDAFGGLIAALFEPHGLLTFQPREETIAKLAAPLHRRGLEDHDVLAAQLAEGAKRLESAGGRVPIPIRTDCALSFFHPDGAAGARYRLMPRGATIGLSGAPQCFDRADVLRRLDDAPLDFSTSGLLRPLLQDSLLPTAAYVGGPTEVAYAAQLGPLYAHFGRTMAPFVRRASFVVTADEDRRALDALSLTLGDLKNDEATLAQRLGRGPVSARIEALAASAKHELAALRASLEELDPGLGKSADKTETAIEQALGKLQGRAERAGAARHPERLAGLRRVLASLRPGGAPQERVYALPSIARLGASRIIAGAVDRAMTRGDASAPASLAQGELELAL